MKALLSDQTDIKDDVDIKGLALDSRTVQPGDAFVALDGAKQHGIEYAKQAVENGATAILYEATGKGDQLAKKITGISPVSVKNLKQKLGEIAAIFYGHPSRQMDVLGITGTNGKTTCSQYLAQLLSQCGIIGTLGWGECGKLHATVNTTPDAVMIQKILREFVQNKNTAVAMEVSSHGLDQGRVNGVWFKGAVFTNISRDHLDYHGTMENYLQAKLSLLHTPGLEFAVINLDDENSERILAEVPEQVTVWGFSINAKKLANGYGIYASNIQYGLDGIACDVSWGKESVQINIPVFGDFNLQNALAVLTTLLAMNVNFQEAAKKLDRLQPVTGRMERFSKDNVSPIVFVDYAHTPDALEKVLSSLRRHCQQKLWVVFGCGGERDHGKRPLMGKIAEQWADKIIVTTDNPRNEKPGVIIKEILAGCKQAEVEIIEDRNEAINKVIAAASTDDLVLIAGKGHEDYQEIAGVRKPFSDCQIVEKALLERCG